jgi:glycosyltransferase involved in cell wall biosynthesis
MAEKVVVIDQVNRSNGTRTGPRTELPAVVGTGLVSVLIPCCGGLESTKLCVPSLLRHSRPPTELIFLDIGSLDGTAEYLAGIQAAAQLRVEVVRALTDQDIGRACARALEQARGEVLVLLNNDCIVPAGWLNQLIALASMSFLPTAALIRSQRPMPACPACPLPLLNYFLPGQSRDTSALPILLVYLAPRVLRVVASETA